MVIFFLADTVNFLNLPCGPHCQNLVPSCAPYHHHPYIFPSFPSFLPSVSLHFSCSSRWAYGHDFWYVDVSWWPSLGPQPLDLRTWFSVSKSIPLALTGPHGQHASSILCHGVVYHGFMPRLCTGTFWTDMVQTQTDRQTDETSFVKLPADDGSIHENKYKSRSLLSGKGTGQM